MYGETTQDIAFSSIGLVAGVERYKGRMNEDDNVVTFLTVMGRLSSGTGSRQTGDCVPTATFPGYRLDLPPGEDWFRKVKNLLAVNLRCWRTSMRERYS